MQSLMEMTVLVRYKEYQAMFNVHRKGN